MASRHNRQYRYYVCIRAQKRGHAHCPTRSVNAQAIEQALLDKLRGLPVDRQALLASPLAETARLFECHEKTGAEHDLSNPKRAQLIRLFLDRVEYDGTSRRLSFRLTEEAATCIKATA